jgi:zinc transporter 1
MPLSESEHEHNHNHDHHHHHGKRQRFFQTKTFRLLAMLSLTFTYFVVELIVGNLTKSVALVADAFHMLSDVISLIIGIVAVRIVKRRSNANTFGWVRAEVVGANINTVFLLALCLTIVFDAIKRFVQPEPIENVNLLLIVGSVGLGINIIGLFLFQGFHGHSHGGHSHGDKKIKPNENIQTDEQNSNLNRFERHSTRALQEVGFERHFKFFFTIEF